MDNVTHTLTAIALARAGGKRITPHATAMLVLAANIPDIDSAWGFVSPLRYLQHHRGITHSLFAAPFLAAGVVFLVEAACRLYARRRPETPLLHGAFLRAYLVALFGVLAAHLFLDWSTSYGERLLLPFSGRWLAWDAVPIIDLWLLAVLAAAVVLPFFFSMIGEEIGANARRQDRGRSAAIFALVFLAGWFGFRGVTHAQAVAALDARLYHGYTPQRVSAFATLGNPFRWTGVVQTDQGWEVAEINVLEEFDPDSARTYYWPEPGAALDAARRTLTARVFLDFARYPYSYVESVENGYRVVFRDLRFQRALGGASGFVAEIVEDRQHHVRSESFSIRGTNKVR